MNVNEFGLIASRDVEGRIYAQPLYVPGITIAGKIRNVVYVATMHNWVYAFDADDLSARQGHCGNGRLTHIPSRRAFTDKIITTSATTTTIPLEF